MNFENCVYRTDVQIDADGERASCRLLALQLAECPGLSFRVTRDVCSLCFAHTQSLLETHPVFPSVVLQQCEMALLEGAVSNREKVQELRDRAEAAILEYQDLPPATGNVESCDVVLYCSEAHLRLDDVIQSVLQQTEVFVLLHLVDGSIEGQLFTRYMGRENILVHHCPSATSAMEAVHEVHAKLRSQYIAIQSPLTISLPRRLANALGELRETGADILGSQGGSHPSRLPQIDQYNHYLAPETLVFRRATFIDMGGSAARPDSAPEFVYRATCEDRRIAVSHDVDIKPLEPLSVVPLGPPPGYSVILVGTLRNFARGFPTISQPCDVVLPFHGQLDYVEQALAGLLESGNDDIVVHLVDDCSPVDTKTLLRRWSAHPQVRTYRNTENIAQFQSFNNIFPYLETDLIAVQDADDISLPNRFREAATLLQLADADYFGGAVELFGDETVRQPVMHETDDTSQVLRTRYRTSYYPEFRRADYFVENPTSVFRKSMFERLGGYPDFGGALVNRASLDTEFQTRCFFSGVRFAVTREVVLNYRVHAQSATQDNQSGWGSKARAAATMEVQRRRKLFLAGRFDPRSFGALGRYQHATQRITFSK
ncbi:MAG: glycosyltransferase family 2 protein [Planctomycetaceae bacterium]|nr:glycosyltransferase family 2 protein [Planctomycetaceae bacterium]